jgi:hypothetical protein
MAIDITGAVDTDALQAEEDIEVLIDLFRPYDVRDIVRFLTALDRHVGLSQDQSARLIELIEEMQDRGWARDDDPSIPDLRD